MTELRAVRPDEVEVVRPGPEEGMQVESVMSRFDGQGRLVETVVWHRRPPPPPRRRPPDFIDIIGYIFWGGVLVLLLAFCGVAANASEPMIDGQLRPTKCMGIGDCLEWPEEPVCPEEPPPGAGATAGGPYATDLTETEEQWRPLIVRYFCADYAVEEAMHVMACESNGDPDVVNPASGTTGLMQIHPMHFDDMDGPPADPEANVEHARDMYVDAWGWFDWHCRPVP